MGNQIRNIFSSDTFFNKFDTNRFIVKNLIVVGCITPGRGNKLVPTTSSKKKKKCFITICLFYALMYDLFFFDSLFVLLVGDVWLRLNLPALFGTVRGWEGGRGKSTDGSMQTWWITFDKVGSFFFCDGRQRDHTWKPFSILSNNSKMPFFNLRASIINAAVLRLRNLILIFLFGT